MVKDKDIFYDLVHSYPMPSMVGKHLPLGVGEFCSDYVFNQIDDLFALIHEHNSNVGRLLFDDVPMCVMNAITVDVLYGRVK